MVGGSIPGFFCPNVEVSRKPLKTPLVWEWAWQNERLCTTQVEKHHVNAVYLPFISLLYPLLIHKQIHEQPSIIVPFILAYVLFLMAFLSFSFHGLTLLEGQALAGCRKRLFFQIIEIISWRRMSSNKRCLHGAHIKCLPITHQIIYPGLIRVRFYCTLLIFSARWGGDEFEWSFTWRQVL